LRYDFLVLYPINPATLAKYRQAFSTAHGKDDPSDADYLLDLLEHHRNRLRSWKPDDEKTRTLRLLVEQRRRLVSDRTRFSNRLTALLKGYFPQVLDWFEDIRTRLVCDFLERWPELSALQRSRPATINQFLRSHHSTSQPTNHRRLQEIKPAIPLTRDAAVMTASVLQVKTMVAQLRATIEAIGDGSMNDIFHATIDATEEAILNALLAAETMVGRDGITAHRLPPERLLEALHL
jgi:ribosomal protein S15P/S13E